MTIATQKIPAGYKQTELGVIPEDWDVKTLGCLFDITSSKRVFQSEWKSSGIPFFRARELAILSEKGWVDNELFISEQMYLEYASKYGIPQIGDILITGVGTLGKVYIVKNDKRFYFKDGNIIWLKNKGYVESLYIDQLYKTPLLIKQINNSSAGTTVGTYTITNAKNTIIPFPSLPEQTVIAAVLSETDALIEHLEKLIAKKKAIKQGTMQQLLTGKKRLPGFSGKWDVRTLDELFTFGGGYSASRDQLSAEGHCYLHYGDIHKSSKTFIDVRSDYQEIPKLDIPLNRVSTVSLLEDGDVVFVDASEDDEGTSRHVVIVNKDKLPFISGLHTIVAKSIANKLDHQYERFCFQTADIKRQFYFYAVGTKVSGISKTNIKKLTLPVPSLSEQSAIATILSDMDAEIESLEEKRNKYTMLKQGMMQELLTGKTRLVKPESYGGAK